MQKSLFTRYNQIFLSMLRDSRRSKGLRQADLVDLLGLAQATVSKVERGERRLDVTELRAWLAALGVDFLRFMRQLDTQLRSNLAASEPQFRTEALRRRTSPARPSTGAKKSLGTPATRRARRLNGRRGEVR